MVTMIKILGVFQKYILNIAKQKLYILQKEKQRDKKICKFEGREIKYNKISCVQF